ncbi:MAG: transpeptidase family protein [Spirochaetia bacterium]|nr:transpeptidase family protein [Spirochaetia bacterium]
MDKTKKAIFIFAIALISLCGLICRYFYLMVLSPRNDAASRNIYRIERGPILDRNGVVLAIQTRLFRVSGWRPTLKNPDYVAKKLSEILEIPEKEIKEKFEKKGGDLIQLARKVSYESAEKIQDLIKSGEISGIRVDNDYGRLYPEKELASHLIGFAGDDNKGLDGIELKMDNYLYPVGNQEAFSGVVYGNQVYLTIDVNIQNFAQQASMDIMDQYEPQDGVITLVADAKTGEILAYVSMPELDLNNYTKYNADDSIKRNKPAIYNYEPGSVFKVFSISSFMHLPTPVQGKERVTPESRFFCNGFYYNVPGPPIKCTGKHGNIDTGDIIKYSCNPGTCTASESVSEEDFYYMITQFGFGSPSGAEISEAVIEVNKVENWTGYSKPTKAMGQEISVNALQIVKAATAIANHGKLLVPHVVKKVVDATGHVVFETGTDVIQEVISPSIADSMLLMMERASQDRGTARRHNVGGVRMSMKTGTAQVYDPEIGTYSKEKFTASCLAIFPTEDPQYIIYNVVFYPKGQVTTGAGIAVPAVGKLANDIISYKGMPRKGDTVLGFDGTINDNGQDKNYSVIDVIPDFTGASKKHLLPLFRDDRFNLVIRGEGWVVKQSPAPGTPVEPGMTLEFELQ